MFRLATGSRVFVNFIHVGNTKAYHEYLKNPITLLFFFTVFNQSWKRMKTKPPVDLMVDERRLPQTRASLKDSSFVAIYEGTEDERQQQRNLGKPQNQKKSVFYFALVCRVNAFFEL